MDDEYNSLLDPDYKYVKNCYYCNALIEAIIADVTQNENNLLQPLFDSYWTYPEKLTRQVANKMSRKTAHKHIKDLKAQGYLIEDGSIRKTLVSLLEFAITNGAVKFPTGFGVIDAESYIKELIRESETKNMRKPLRVSMWAIFIFQEAIYKDRIKTSTS